MKLRRTITIGVALVTSVLVLVFVSFFLSQGSCSQGTFLCSNSSLCIPQRSMCNGYDDCPKGEDEAAATCGDFHGGNFVKTLLMGTKNKSKEYYTCALDGVPEACRCLNKTYVYCKNLGLREVPQGISTNVTRLILANNSIQVEEDSFTRYPKLNLIHLEGNQINKLPTGAFRNLTDLSKILLINNSLETLDLKLFNGLNRLTFIFLQNNLLGDFDLEVFLGPTKLEYLVLSRNMMTMNQNSFPDLPTLTELQLDGNQIEEIKEETFSRLIGLEYLNLKNNRITKIHPKAFQHLLNLNELDLSHNQLTMLSRDVFAQLGSLNKLFIGHNPLLYVPQQLFFGLHNLASLNLEDIDIVNIDLEMFSFLTNLDFIYLKKFYYCTFVPGIPKCVPNTDGVSTAENLLGRPVLRLTVWLVGLTTCLGNCYVFWGRLTSRDENKVLSWIVRNLAVSDFLMGVYLLVIGTKDLQYRNQYHSHSHAWISSWTCTLIGALAMLSSEVSILILVFMSLERFLLIAMPFGGHKTLSPKGASYSLGVIWMCGISVSIVPIVHWRNSTRFYGANSMCFPLHIDDPYFAGWQFSAFVFIGINMTGIAVIAFLYSGMFMSIWRTRHATTLNLGDCEFAVRFFFIVLTNTACWAPIITLKVLAFCRIYISADTYSWVAVFIIPVNSACNPLLYTLTTPKYRELIRHGLTRGRKQFTFSRQQLSTADTCSHTSGNRNVVGSCTVSVHSGAVCSKTSSFDLPTFNTSQDPSNEDAFASGSRGNSFDTNVVGVSFDEVLTAEK